MPELQQARELMALDAFVELLDEGLEARAAGMGPQRQFKDVDTALARLTAADDVLTDLHTVCQLHLADASLFSQGVQLLEEQLVLLTVERVSHPAAVASATEQDQREGKLWENAIIPISTRLQAEIKRCLGARAQAQNVGVHRPPSDYEPPQVHRIAWAARHWVEWDGVMTTWRVAIG